MRNKGLVDHVFSTRLLSEDDRLWSEEELTAILIAAFQVHQCLARKKVRVGIANAALKHALRMVDQQHKWAVQELMSYVMPKAKIIPFPRKNGSNGG